jgi:NTE family protein
MGADIIIGVNVGSSDKPKIEDIKSISEILMTSAMIGSNIVLDASIQATDYLITPELYPYTSASFFNGREIVDRGEEAARKHMDAFKQLADSFQLADVTYKINHNYTPQQIIVNDIIINNRKHVSQNYFYTKLGVHAGDTISVDDINNGIRRLIGSSFYKQITYHLKQNDSTYTLVFNTEEANLAQAKFSIHYDNELKAGIISNLTIKSLLVKNSRLSLTTDISEKPRLHGEMIAYLGEQQSTGFIGNGYFERTTLPVYENNLKTTGTLNYYKNQAGAGLFFSFKTRTIFAIKLDWEEIKVSQDTGFSDIFGEGVRRFGNGFVYGSLIIDQNTLNKRFFANKGHHLHIAGKLNFNAYELYKGEMTAKPLVNPLINVPEEHYVAGSLRYTRNFITSKSSFIEAGISLAGFSANAPFFDMHYIGGTAYNISTGDAAFVGLNYREKIAENYSLASIKLNFNITKVLYAHFVANSIYGLNFGNDTFVNQPFFLSPKEYIIGFGGGIAVNSIIGPITVGLGTNIDDWRVRAYISVGFPFM